MRYKAKKEEELNQFTVFDDGTECSFVVSEASDEISSKGNEMIKLKLTLFNDKNRKGGTYDYLLEAMLFKVKHFCETTGLDYESEYLDASLCLGKSGMCKVKKEEYKGEWQNKIEDYITGDDFIEGLKKDAEDEEL